jgi:hypothetical protein
MITKPVEDFISDYETEIASHAMNSRTQGACSYLTRDADNRPISADVARVGVEVVADPSAGYHCCYART